MKKLILSENDTSLKYSEKPEALKKVLDNLNISVDFLGAYPRLFGDKATPNYRVSVENIAKKITISFEYYSSIAHNEVLTLVNFEKSLGRDLTKFSSFERARLQNAKLASFEESFLYRILCCIRSDYSCPERFSDFCSEYGYDMDSRKALALHEECIKQKQKLEKVFTESEIECLPS